MYNIEWCEPNKVISGVVSIVARLEDALRKTVIAEAEGWVESGENRIFLAKNRALMMVYAPSRRNIFNDDSIIKCDYCADWSIISKKKLSGLAHLQIISQ